MASRYGEPNGKGAFLQVLIRSYHNHNQSPPIVLFTISHYSSINIIHYSLFTINHHQSTITNTNHHQSLYITHNIYHYKSQSQSYIIVIQHRHIIIVTHLNRNLLLTSPRKRKSPAHSANHRAPARDALSHEHFAEGRRRQEAAEHPLPF